MKARLLGLATLAAATLAFAAPALAGPPRYQWVYGTLEANVNNSAYIHDYPVTLNPCGPGGTYSFSGTVNGTIAAIPTLNEAISFTMTGLDSSSIITFHSSYAPGTYNPTYQWNYMGPMSGGSADAGVFSVVWTLKNVTYSTFRNHGEFVTSGGDPESCIGRPIEEAWSQSGTIPSTTPDGTTITLPDVGTYRIDVSGTWYNNSWGYVDAEYAQYLGTWYDGFDHNPPTPYALGPGFGDVQIDSAFVDWGAYNINHVYSLSTAFTGLSTNLRIFDGDSNTNTVMPAWYGDNTGSLNYTITYLGP